MALVEKYEVTVIGLCHIASEVLILLNLTTDSYKNSGREFRFTGTNYVYKHILLYVKYISNFFLVLSLILNFSSRLEKKVMLHSQILEMNSRS